MIEYNEEYNRQLTEIIRQYPNHYGPFIRAHYHKEGVFPRSHRYLYDYILKCTKDFLDDSYTFTTKLGWVLDKLQDFPKCKICGKYLNSRFLCIGFDNEIRPKWKTYCSSQCWHKDPKVLDKMKHTLEERYGKGVTNVFQVESVKEKCDSTREEKYGNRNYRNMEKVAKTCLEKYGSKSVLSSEYGKKRIRETNLKKYGVEHTTQSSEIRSKMHRTYDYDGQNFDTGWELAFYIWHKDHGIELIHEPDKLQYEDRNGNKHFYFPDFKIRDIYYEIKGGQFFDKDGNPLDDYKDKFEFMKNIGVVLIREKEIKPYLEYVAEKYGKNFLKSCKRNGKQKF